jgi:hypothetical protein
MVTTPCPSPEVYQSFVEKYGLPEKMVDNIDFTIIAYAFDNQNRHTTEISTKESVVTKVD